MDPLSDVLRTVRLDGAYFYGVEAREPWSVEAVEARELSPRILPASEHLIAYHILTAGRCFGGLAGGPQVELAPGDVIVFPHGDAHWMSSGRGLRLPGDAFGSVPARYPDTVILGPGGQPTASFVCGFLGCDLHPFNPLLASLPRMMPMRGLSRLGAFTRAVTEESRLGRPGSEEVLTRLAELMFVEVLRHHLDELPSAETGWLAGLRDDVVGRALTLLHARPGHPWTLARLAAICRTLRPCSRDNHSTSRMVRMDNLTAGTPGSGDRVSKEARARVSYPAPRRRSGGRHQAKRVSDMLRNSCPASAETGVRRRPKYAIRRAALPRCW